MKFSIVLISLLIISCGGSVKPISSHAKKSSQETNKPASKTIQQNEKAIVIYVNANGFIIDSNFKKAIKLGFEEIATSNKYVIIDDEVKKKAFERIKKAHSWSQNDPRFLIEFGKQVSASKMVYIDIIKFSDENYKLSNRWISLKDGIVKNTKTFSFNYQFNEDTKEILFTEIQRLASYFLTKQIENRIVLSIDSKVKLDDNLKKIIKLAFEEIATDNNYSIVDDNLKDKAYKRILKEHNYSQNDPKFLVELNKQLSANEMVVIEITEQGDNKYLFTNKLLNLESGLNIKTENKVYNKENDKDYLNLFKTVQKLANDFLCKNCVNKKTVYLDFKGVVMASGEYQHVYSTASEVLTKKGYLISNNKKDSDFQFSVFITKKDNGTQLSLKKINKNNKVFSYVNKTCKSNNLVICVKYLLTKKFQQKKVMNTWGMEFIEIPKGEFYLGYNNEDALSIEKQSYKKVVIANNFFIARTETSQRFWKHVMNNNPSKNICDDCPVESVSFNDIMSFIEKLNVLDKKFNYRLPSEAEWEYMARDGKETPFFWGTTEASLDQYAWYGGNSNNKSHKIATKKPNYWGVFDVVGNVFEFTSSFEKIKYFNKKTLKYAMKDMRIAKGGCFSSKDSAHLRSTIHIRIKSENKSSSKLGFRLIIEKKK